MFELPLRLDPALESRWQAFDGVVCITLREGGREDNIRKMSELAHITNMEVLRFERHPEGGMKGCFDSHIRVAKHALERGWNNVLVFEDDFMPTTYLTPDAIDRCLDFVKKAKQWDVLYLGGMPCNSYTPCYPSTFPHIYRASANMYETHAYVMGRGMIEFVASINHTINIPYDGLTSLVRSFQHRDLLFTQLLADSTIAESPHSNFNYSTAILAHGAMYRLDQTGLSIFTLMALVLALLIIYILPIHDYFKLIGLVVVIVWGTILSRRNGGWYNT
jgi:GR25 family glycosyltransferase involved in LPS biosynthesis